MMHYNKSKEARAALHRAVTRVAEELGVDVRDLKRDDYIDNKRQTEPSNGCWRGIPFRTVLENAAVGDSAHPEVPEDVQAHIEAEESKAAKKNAQTRKRARHAQARAEDLERALDVAIGLKENKPISSVNARPFGCRGGLRESTPVLLVSDLHIGETVDPKQINWRNEYNPRIARRRIEKLVQGFLWKYQMWSSVYQMDTAVVAFLGDVMSGYIHEELMQTNEVTPLEEALLAQELCALIIDSILVNTNGLISRLLVPCVFGNHGRTTKKIQAKNAAKMSYEWLIYQQLKNRYAGDDRVEFIISDGLELYLDIYDWKFRFIHGDQIRYGGGIGGVSIPLYKAIHALNENIRADYTCLGHFHECQWPIRAVINGSVIGWSEFAVRIKARYEEPRQCCFLVDSKHGLSERAEIWVDEPIETREFEAKR